MTKNDLFEVKLYNREKDSIENEIIFEKKLMDFIYNNPKGELLTRKLLVKKFISALYGIFQDSSLSKKSIMNFVKKYDFNLDEMELPLEKYQSFNEFFTRKLKPGARKIETDKNILISPADSKLIVYKIDNNLVVPVKGLGYSMSELLRNSEVAQEFNNGYCMIFRLAPMDYHRFCYIDDGKQEEITNIDGLYYSVHPYALSKNHPAFTQNHRQYTLLKTENFGDVIYMEVGAMFVGTIYQHNPFSAQFQKGEEKGYFKFGGSTVILLFKENTVKIDEDIMKYSSQGIETIVKYGSGIGKALCNGSSRI